MLSGWFVIDFGGLECFAFLLHQVCQPSFPSELQLSNGSDMEKDENLPWTPIQGIKKFRKNNALFSFKMLKNRGVNLN